MNKSFDHSLNHSSQALKIDAEGMEWDFWPDWIGSFHDWIVCCHYPVLNAELHKWLIENGEVIATPDPDRKNGEFAVYKKYREWNLATAVFL